MKALSPAKVKEVRLDEETGTAEVIVPDYQLSLSIGKEGQNARLAARLTGWRIDIKSESQLAEEEAGYAGEEWAEGEWVTDAETGQLTWRPAEGGPAVTADEWRQGGDVPPGDEDGAPDGATSPAVPAPPDMADASAEAPADAPAGAEVSSSVASEAGPAPAVGSEEPGSDRAEGVS